MDLEQLREHMDGRFDKVEEKLENFGKVAHKNQNDITWIKGHLQVALTILLSVAGFFAMAYFTSLGD